MLHYMRAALVLASVAGALLGGQDQAPLPVHVLADALVVHDAFSSHCESGSKEVRAVLEALRNHYTSGAMATITWLPGRYQRADGLTKATGASNPRAAMAPGELTLRCGSAKWKQANKTPPPPPHPSARTPSYSSCASVGPRG